MIRNIKMSLVAVMVLGLTISALAQEAAQEATQEKKIEVLSKKISGEVAGVSKNFLAVMYDQDEEVAYEMTFKVEKDVKVLNIGDLLEIKFGDTVSVNYEETVELDPVENKIKSRVAKVISFVKAAPLQNEKELISE
jgi:Cu/Ag efflux protein CusF